MPTRVVVTSNQIVDAKYHIEKAITSGIDGTYVDLTASGALMHVLMELGIVLDVTS